MTIHSPIDRRQELRDKAPRRGLRREEASAYVGVSGTKFDDWVRRGLMPRPKRVDGIVVWDRWSLDSAFEALPDGDAGPKDNPWD